MIVIPLNRKNINNIKKTVILFFMLGGLFSCDSQLQQQASLANIIERDHVTVGTLFGPNSFYLQGSSVQRNNLLNGYFSSRYSLNDYSSSDNDHASGFEYELAKKYADYLNVDLKIVPSYSLDELFMKLNKGEVDILAAGISITDKRLSRFRFSPAYQKVSQKLVYKQGNIRPRKLVDLTGNLTVTTNASYVENLEKLKLSHSELNWQETSEFDSEELLIKILNGDIDYSIVDSNTLAINRRYYPEISVAFTIKKAESLAWMVSKNSDDAVLSSLIEFFGKVHHDGTLLALNEKYYGHVEKFDYVDTRTFIKAVEQKLPKYQKLFEKHSQELDWRLLAAISYQESHWRPHARSPTGVRGMMMLTLATAKQMGVKSRLDAEQSIFGGAKYFKRMINKMPDRIPSPDRIWFALASYNVGFGHLNDARIITQRQGSDPDRWVEVKKRLPLLQQKKYYKKTKYGYARGEEPVHYVENIRRYYHTLSWLDDKSKEEERKLKENTYLPSTESKETAPAMESAK